MCFNTKRKPLRPREGPYRPTNAYTIQPCCEQIFTVLMVLTQIILHSVFIVSPITMIDNPILYIIMTVHYILLIIQVIDYIVITFRDPVDRCLISTSFLKRQRKKGNIRECFLCRSPVTRKSYHCKKCNRCTEGFDHHCSFLGTCIGSKNYQNFIRILMVFIGWNLTLIIQAGWVLKQAEEKGEEIVGIISKWACIPILAISCGLLFASAILCLFHLYLCLCVDLTTLEFIQSQDSTSFRQDNPKGTPEFFRSYENLQS